MSDVFYLAVVFVGSGGVLLAVGFFVFSVAKVLVNAGTDTPGGLRIAPTPLQSARARIEATVAEHLPTLARRRMALLRTDAYGIVVAEPWTKECQYFVDEVVWPKLTELEAKAIAEAGLGKLMTELLEEPVRAECARLEASFSYDEAMSPLDYERYCAAQLEAAGWSCEVTKASGDQGADIVARQGGATLVVQCKKYGQPVGNAAVQEVIAAKAHLKARFAAVVSNAAYTRSAVELAGSTGVLLLHHADLDLVGARLGLSSAPERDPTTPVAEAPR